MSGKTRSLWRLVLPERGGGKVRQVAVARLGELDAQGRSKASKLAKQFLGPRANERELFEGTSRMWSLNVLGDKVCMRHGRGFGDVWLAPVGGAVRCSANSSSGMGSIGDWSHSGLKNLSRWISWCGLGP